MDPVYAAAQHCAGVLARAADQHAALHEISMSLCPRRKEWTLLRDDSIFVDWQRLKVQENVEEVSSSCDGPPLTVLLGWWC